MTIPCQVIMLHSRFSVAVVTKAFVGRRLMCQGQLSAASLITASLVSVISKAIISRVAELLPLFFVVLTE